MYYTGPGLNSRVSADKVQNAESEIDHVTRLLPVLHQDYLDNHNCYLHNYVLFISLEIALR